MRRDQIALQLYTLRELAARDLAGTLRAVSDAGYRSVELAGLPDVPAPELARLLDDSGLSVVASHEGIEALRRDATAVADRLAELGCPRVVVPWMPEEDRRTTDAVGRFADELSGLVATFASYYMRVGYHNHAFEFDPLEGLTLWDALLDRLSPEVELELDAYWLSVGGRDAAAEIMAQSDRVRLLHIKDRAAGPEPRDAPAGQGILPFPAIVDAGDVSGVEWYIVEQDDPQSPLDDIATSLRYLESLAD